MALPVVAAAVAGKRLSKKGRAKAKDKRAARQEKRADRKEKRADKLEAKGKGAKAAVKRAKAGVKKDKASKNTARAGELRKKAAANKAKRQEIGKKVKAKAKAGAKKVGKAATKAIKANPGVKAAKAVGKAAKKAGGKAKGVAKEVKKRAKAVVSAASGQPEMGKQPAMMKDMKQAAKNVKAGFEYGAKSFADEASTLYKAGKKKVKSAAKSVVDAKNKTFGENFVKDNIVDPIKSDAKAAYKKFGPGMEDEQAMREAKKEERGKGANLGSMSDGNAMAKKSMPMMRAGMKGGPSMIRIQYGNQASGRNMSNYTRQSGRPGMSGPGMILSKHMKGPKMGHKK